MEAFGGPAYDNVEFRTFDVLPTEPDNFVRVRPEGSAPLEQPEILGSVVRQV